MVGGTAVLLFLQSTGIIVLTFVLLYTYVKLIVVVNGDFRNSHNSAGGRCAAKTE